MMMFSASIMEKITKVSRAASTKRDELVFDNLNHNSTLIQRIEREPQDCVLRVGQKEFPVHREIMSLVSEYFEASLRFDNSNSGASTNEPDRNKMVEIRLDDMNEETVNALIGYAYSGKLKITTKNVRKILISAEFLFIESISDACVNYLMDRLDCNNAVELLKFSQSICSLKLENDIFMYITRNFSQFYASKTYLNFDTDLLVKVLSCDKLVMMKEMSSGKKIEFMFVNPGRQEELVFGCVLYYAKKNKVIDLLPDLLTKTVRINLISVDMLDVLSQIKEISKSTESLQYMESARRNLLTHFIPRDLSDVLAVTWSEEMAYNVFDNLREISDFDDSHMVTADCPVLYITEMTIYQRNWCDRDVIGGLRIKYSNGLTVQHGNIGERHRSVNSFSLHSDERITKVIAQAGWMIDSLSFETTKKRKFGPYGGIGGGQIDIERPCTSGYLAFVKGKVMHSLYETGIRHLQFGWVHCRAFE